MARQPTQPVREQAVRCPAKALVCESDTIRARWVGIVPADHTIEDVLNPHYFGHYTNSAKALRVKDVIEIEPENGLWWAYARIMAVRPKLQQVEIRLLTPMQDYAEELPPGYRWEWKGPEGGWAIWKGKLLILTGFATQTQGKLELADGIRNGFTEATGAAA